MQLEPVSSTTRTTNSVTAHDGATNTASTQTVDKPRRQAPVLRTASALVALDIDGTIAATGTTQITTPVRDAVARVRAAGHHVVLASGRSLIGILPIAARLGITAGWVVASNGAVTARLSPGVAGGYTLEDVRTFDPEPVLQRALALMPEVNLAVEEVGWGYRVLDHFGPGVVNGDQEIVPLADLWSVPTTRAIVKAPHAARRLLEPLRSLGVTATPAADDWIDVTPTNLSKATSLEIIRRTLHVSAERTIAVGDGVNDLEMMRWAARGVAMGHSSDKVKAGADEVTGTLGDDGLVPVLLSV